MCHTHQVVGARKEGGRRERQLGLALGCGRREAPTGKPLHNRVSEHPKKPPKAGWCSRSASRTLQTRINWRFWGPIQPKLALRLLPAPKADDTLSSNEPGTLTSLTPIHAIHHPQGRNSPPAYSADHFQVKALWVGHQQGLYLD